MFCPNCGTEENQNTQYCRSCGRDLQLVRSVVEQPENIMGSTLLTKSDIGRSLLEKIDSAASPKDLKKVAENVLPKIERFLETPEEKRLRLLRNGSLVALIGLGVSIASALAAIFEDPEIIKGVAAGFVTMCVGFGMMINAHFFTVPGDKRSDPLTNKDKEKSEPHKTTNDLLMPASAQSHFSSVTEPTTRTLDDKVPVENRHSNE